MTKRTTPLGVEYRISYRRRWSEREQQRIFQQRHRAYAFVRMLLKGDPRWEPIEELRVEQRTVGKWSTIEFRDDS